MSNSVNILVNQNYYYMEKKRDKTVDELGPFLSLSGIIRPQIDRGYIRPLTFYSALFELVADFWPVGNTAVLSL